MTVEYSSAIYASTKAGIGMFVQNKCLRTKQGKHFNSAITTFAECR